MSAWVDEVVSVTSGDLPEEYEDGTDIAFRGLDLQHRQLRNVTAVPEDEVGFEDHTMGEVNDDDEDAEEDFPIGVDDQELSLIHI